MWSATTLALGAGWGCGASAGPGLGANDGGTTDVSSSSFADASFAGAGDGSSSGASPEDASSDAGLPDDDTSDACTWNLGSGVPEGSAPTQDNSADMTGATFGTDAFDVTQRRRTVPVTVATPFAGIALGPAYFTRPIAGDESAALTLVVTNSGTDFPCFVTATTYQWLGATGQVLSTTSGLYLDGLVGFVNVTDTDTCLAPGETGYFTDVQAAEGSPLYSAVASVSIGLASSGSGTTPAAKFVPNRYDIGTCAGNRTLRVEGIASGAEVSVGDLGGDLAPAIFLDATGLPVGWSLLSQMQPANVAVGAGAYFFDNGPEPAVSRARVFLPFEPPDPTIMSLQGFVLREVQAVRASRLDRVRRWQLTAQRAANPFAR